MIPVRSIAVAALLTSCGGGSKLPVVDGAVVLEDGGTAPLIEVGTGTDSFVPLREGDSVPIIAGPQGGFHIWTSLRARAPVHPLNVLIDLRVIHDGVTLSNHQRRLNLDERGAFFEWYALTAFIPDPNAVRGKPVQLSLDLTDANGLVASDVRTVIPQDP